MSSIIIAAIETEQPTGKRSSFEPYGYGSVIDNPIVIPEENIDTVYVEEGRFEQWTVEARDAEGNIVSMRAMREPIK